MSTGEVNIVDMESFLEWRDPTLIPGLKKEIERIFGADIHPWELYRQAKRFGEEAIRLAAVERPSDDKNQ